MKISIPYLTSKRAADGRARFFWQPSARLRAAGWKAIALGTDFDAAVAQAKAQNDKVQRWSAGGERPREVKKLVAPRTLDALIAAYKVDRFKPADQGGLATATQRQYQSRFRLFSAWAGDKPLAFITRARVRELIAQALKPLPDGTIRHHMADETARVLRTLLQWGVDHEWMADNPAVRPGISKPAPRHQVWSPDAREAIVAAAMADAAPSMALAVDLAFMVGQREADLLKLSITQVVDIPPHKLDADLVAAVSGADGRIVGVRLRQGKTRRWVEVPVVGDTRVRLLAAVEAARKAGRFSVLFDDARDQPWTGDAGQRAFIRRFADLRDNAIAAAVKADDTDLAAELRDLQFRDFRRTAVVHMGELGLADQLVSAVTGHSLDETKRILETYMPRTTGMAVRAIALSHARPLPKADRTANE